MQSTIDRSSPLPYYHQLKQILVANIEQSELATGDRLPGDHELCATYGISRTVVRQALTELEFEGVIERMKGRGTFVAQRKTPEGLVQSLTGLYEDVAARGGKVRSEVLRCEVVPADAHVAAELELEPGQSVIELERLRYVDEKLWNLTIARVPYDLAPGLEQEDFSDTSLYALLEGKYGVRLMRGRRSVEATSASAAIARSLGIRRGAPVLTLRSVSYGTDDRPVESFVGFHRGDLSRFEVELSRTNGAVERAARRRPGLTVSG